ncbi:MAG: DUF3592 domain-containing protein [Oscillospiraceae bacterium]|nr:DUF3592 domain-containing protein [Oscillospiraceae bacterium]
MSAVNKGRNSSLVGCIVLIVFGAVFFLIGMSMLRAYGDKGSCTEQVSARVVKMIEHKSGGTSIKHNKTSTTYAPVFEYEYEGKKYTYTSTVASNPPEFSTGQRVTIWVDPNAPNKIYYEPGGTSVLLSIVFRIVGGAAAVGGVAMLIVSMVKSRRCY